MPLQVNIFTHLPFPNRQQWSSELHTHPAKHFKPKSVKIQPAQLICSGTGLQKDIITCRRQIVRAVMYPVPVSLSIAPPMVSKSSLSTVFLKTVKYSLPWFSLTITRCHKHKISALIFGSRSRYFGPESTGSLLPNNRFILYCTLFISTLQGHNFARSYKYQITF